MCLFWNRFFCVFFISFFRCVYKSNHMLFAMFRPKNLRIKNSRLFAQSFMEIVIIGWNADKVTLNVCLKFVFFFGNSSLVRPSWKIFAGLMIRCRANAPFTFDTVFFYLFWWWIFVKSLHMFSCFFFCCCFVRVSLVEQQVIWLEFIISLISM